MASLHTAPASRRSLMVRYTVAPAHRWQFVTEGLRGKTVLLLLQQTGYRFPGRGDPVAPTLQHSHQVRT